MSYTSQVTPIRIQLAAFNRTVETDGLLALINFTVTMMGQFGEYELLVTNSIGTSKHGIEIVPEGMYIFLYDCYNRSKMETHALCHLN